MTPRQRYIETLTFGSPDKIPFRPGTGRKSTRARWHSEGLPEAKNPITHVMELLGIEPDRAEPPVRLDADFRMIPQFEEEVLQHKNGHYIVRDWKGNICEISDEYDVTYLREAIDFVTRRWLSCPVQTRDDWEQMKTRYDIDAPGRFPADFAARCEMARQRNHVFSFRFSGPFWQMREWCGFEGLCILMAEQPEFVDEMAEFWTDFASRMLDRILAHVVPDSVGFNEDMAYKAKAMISPEMTRRFCKPSWDRWTRQLRSAGVPLIDMDSDGFVGELIPIWIEAGINVCDPIEVAAHNDIVEFRQQFGREMAYTGGVDKRAMARGGRTLRDEIRRIEPVVRDGGYIPGCDHGIPADVSWQDFVDYCRLLAQITGWL